MFKKDYYMLTKKQKNKNKNKKHFHPRFNFVDLFASPRLSLEFTLITKTYGKNPLAGGGILRRTTSRA